MGDVTGSVRGGDGVSVHRHEELAGVELFAIERCSQAWPRFCTELELVISETFSGTIWYRRQLHDVAPGTPFLAPPGSVLRVVEVRTPGALGILSLSAELIAELQRSTPASAVRASAANTSPARSAAADAGVLRSLRDGVVAEQPLRCLLGSLLAPLLRAPSLLVPLLPGPRYAVEGAACVAELGSVFCPLNMTDGVSPRADLSRFQSDRRFVYRNGLPPYAYQLCLRIARAKHLLRAGASPSQAASAQGFADQSHFTRHFRRWVGLTPRQYALAGAATPDARARRQVSSSVTTCRP